MVLCFQVNFCSLLNLERFTLSVVLVAVQVCDFRKLDSTGVSGEGQKGHREILTAVLKYEKFDWTSVLPLHM